MTPWGWTPERTEGIWRHGTRCMRPFVAAAPWLSVIVVLLTFHLIGGRLTAAKGLLFELPDSSAAEGEVTDAVALVLPMGRDTIVFFDDARYVLSEASSVEALAEHLTERFLRTEKKCLLVLADRRIASGDLACLGALAKKAGCSRILFGEKTSQGEMRE